MTGFPAFTVLLFSAAALACSSRQDCDEIESAAGALVNEFAACEPAERCILVDLGSLVPNACLGAFQCSAAFAEGSSLEEFSRRARALEQEFSRCGKCAMADCANTDEWTAYCDHEQGRCRLRAPE
jgi:hypothetical protein